MTCTKVERGQGQFDIPLHPLPLFVQDALDPAKYGFGLVVVTPGQLPLGCGTSVGTRSGGFQYPGTTRTYLLGISMFTGVVQSVTTSETAAKVEGCHASWYLGDEQGRGDLPEAWIGAGDNPQTLGEYTKARGTAYGLRPASLGAGNLNDTVATRDYATQLKTPREDLGVVHDLFGDDYTYRVTDDLKLDSGTTGQIYGNQRPLLTPFYDGSDVTTAPGFTPTVTVGPAINATFEVEGDLTDYVTRVRAEGSDPAINYATTASVIPYEDGIGGTLRIVHNVTATSGAQELSIDAVNALSASMVAKESQLTQRVTVHTDLDSVMSVIDCGQWVFCWDPANGVMTTSNVYSCYFRGQCIFPLPLRVMRVTMPIESGMGVYFLDKNDQITDLTPYVDWESSGAQLEVGAVTKRLAKSMQLTGFNR